MNASIKLVFMVISDEMCLICVSIFFPRMKMKQVLLRVTVNLMRSTRGQVKLVSERQHCLTRYQVPILH